MEKTNIKELIKKWKKEVTKLNEYQSDIIDKVYRGTMKKEEAQRMYDKAAAEKSIYLKCILELRELIENK